MGHDQLAQGGDTQERTIMSLHAGQLKRETHEKGYGASLLTRRSFLQGTALTSSGFLLTKSGSVDANSESQVESPWYQRVYRRNVIDMHITDWNEKFLSEFNPENYVEMLRLAQVKSAVVCAQSHVGLSNFPTKVGRTHNGMKGKDHLRRVIELCHQSGIGVQLYFSVIFDRWAYDNHPDWRIILVNGKQAAEKSRQGLNCPNSPYREYVAARIEEICQQFDFEGIRFDMTFWPAVCYCAHCQKRFENEDGRRASQSDSLGRSPVGEFSAEKRGLADRVCQLFDSKGQQPETQGQRGTSSFDLHS